MLLPSSQKAGHIPWDSGSRMLASMRPYWKLNSPSVFSRADVKSPAAYPPGVVCRATMLRPPPGATKAFGVVVLHGVAVEPQAQ